MDPTFRDEKNKNNIVRKKENGADEEYNFKAMDEGNGGHMMTKNGNLKELS